MILTWVKMVAWAELVNVGLILVAVGAYGLIRSLTTAKAASTLSDVVRRQIDEVLASCKFGGNEDGREDHTRTYP